MKASIFPGQGSQVKGMGGVELFTQFPSIIEKANDILGYSVEELCLANSNKLLNKTQYTQPALYTVCCLEYLQIIESKQSSPDFLAGHSLGEYVALFAAGVFDFVSGLKLVQKRGELMGQASGGTMAAITNFDEENINFILQGNGLTNIDIANYNSPLQIVLSGPKTDIIKAYRLFEEKQSECCFILNVSAPFHSRYMKSVAKEFSVFLDEVEFSLPKIPVIANVTAQPYGDTSDAIKTDLLQQIEKPVQWTKIIQYLLEKDVIQFDEIGPGDVLTKLVTRIQSKT